jgi:hypothetical protein
MGFGSKTKGNHSGFDSRFQMNDWIQREIAIWFFCLCLCIAGICFALAATTTNDLSSQHEVNEPGLPPPPHVDGQVRHPRLDAIPSPPSLSNAVKWAVARSNQLWQEWMSQTYSASYWHTNGDQVTREDKHVLEPPLVMQYPTHAAFSPLTNNNAYVLQLSENGIWWQDVSYTRAWQRPGSRWTYFDNRPTNLPIRQARIVIIDHFVPSPRMAPLSFPPPPGKPSGSVAK